MTVQAALFQWKRADYSAADAPLPRTGPLVFHLFLTKSGHSSPACFLAWWYWLVYLRSGLTVVVYGQFLSYAKGSLASQITLHITTAMITWPRCPVTLLIAPFWVEVRVRLKLQRVVILRSLAPAMGEALEIGALLERLLRTFEHNVVACVYKAH